MCGGVKGLGHVFVCHGWPVEQLDALKVHNNSEGLWSTCDVYCHCVLQATGRSAVPWVRWSLADLGLIPGKSIWDLW